MTRAAKASGLHRNTWYRRRSQRPEFAAAWAEALERGTDALEDEAVRRAVEGVLKPVFHQGKRVGALRIYSDSLLMFMLRARRPDRFAERIPDSSNGDDLIARLKAGRARIERRTSSQAVAETTDTPETPSADMSADE